MKAITLTAGTVAFITGIALSESEVLIPPILTTIFAISSAITVTAAFFWQRKEDA